VGWCECECAVLLNGSQPVPRQERGRGGFQHEHLVRLLAISVLTLTLWCWAGVVAAYLRGIALPPIQWSILHTHTRLVCTATNRTLSRSTTPVTGTPQSLDRRHHTCLHRWHRTNWRNVRRDGVRTLSRCG
jgi:hypothetical protein